MLAGVSTLAIGRRAAQIAMTRALRHWHWLRDRLMGPTELISRDLDSNPGTGRSAVISGDGRFIAFISGGQTLVAGHPEFDINDHVYVFDRQTQTMERALETISPSGSVVAR
jgi:hypothetical protein